MHARHTMPLESLLDVPAGGPRQQHMQLGDQLAQPGERPHQRVRALDRLGLASLAPADGVLLEGADDERVLGQAELSAHRAAGLRRARAEVRELDADRDPEDLRGVDPAL